MDRWCIKVESLVDLFGLIDTELIYLFEIDYFFQKTQLFFLDYSYN